MNNIFIFFKKITMEKTLYPKTTRISNQQTVITEKLDWSNLWIFNLWGRLLIAQRNHIFFEDELDSTMTYKWLIWWIKDNRDNLNFHEWSWVFWEWIWMGKIKYPDNFKKFYIFAKANIDDKFEVRNINYNIELFIYPFIDSKIPECIWVVPKVDCEWRTDIDGLNTLYDKYCSEVWRQVEWFIINNNNQITKYVRLKNWTLTPHKS